MFSVVGDKDESLQMARIAIVYVLIKKFDVHCTYEYTSSLKVFMVYGSVFEHIFFS